ncbi:ThuA domain-containing protein [Ramlibacter sp. USB13]|uniref:ThuA domain-containing protein n=1 Tax=Ramlibacter cellulosilyticus TaxID=2764187 RepID=A0A923MVD9_9BURK|nr:ThuA domain-containing protein [Ramlibacter cellulosilyticus]MBC5784447.1 ThuA domain-containing protein [Ramlibacter cellulosilyticus]
MIQTTLRLGFATLVAAMSIGAAHAAPANSFAPGQEKKVPPSNFDPYYNVCRGTDPACLAQNKGWPEMSASTKTRVLIYSRTAGPRHANLGTAAPAGSGLNPPFAANNVMQATLKAWLAEEGITADWTENPANFSPNNYAAVILASGNRDNLFDIAQTSPTTPMTNLRQYMRRGGGVVAIHNAFGANYNWPYYEGLLGNANFYDHGPNRAGVVNTLADDPSTAGLPATWNFQDEWYNLTPFPTNVKFLLSATVNPGGTGAATVRDFHPVAWCQYFDGGRVFATTLGHNANSFDGTGVGAAEFKKFIVAGIKSAMGLTPFCTAN